MQFLVLWVLFPLYGCPMMIMICWRTHFLQNIQERFLKTKNLLQFLLWLALQKMKDYCNQLGFTIIQIRSGTFGKYKICLWIRLCTCEHYLLCAGMMRYVKPITFWDLSHWEMMASVKKLKPKLMQSNSNISLQMEKCRMKNIFKVYQMHLQILVFIMEQAKWQSKYLLRQVLITRWTKICLCNQWFDFLIYHNIQ